MSRFRFRLARLLRVREIEERLARERWVAQELASREADALVERRRAEHDLALRELGELRAKPRLDPAAVLDAESWGERLLAARGAALERARTARFQADELAGAWRLREREKEGLERLSRRDREIHRRASDAVETKALDEIALMRAARRARANEPRRRAR